MSYKGFKDLVYNVINPNISTRYRISRTIGRVEFFRNFLAKVYGTNNPDLCQKNIIEGLILNKNESLYVDGVQNKGFELGISLSEDLTSKIIDFSDNSLFSVNRDENKKININYDNLNNPIESAHIYSYIDPHLDSQLIYNIATDCRLLQIAKEYLGCNPRILTTQLWYTFPNKETTEHHNFGYHIDLDDVKFLKLFFYLDDVSEKNGPHFIIARTNKGLNWLKLFNRQISENIAKDHFNEDITMMIGNRGDGFFEDTYTYHKGTSVQEKRRLLFQIEYGVSSKEKLNFDYLKSIAYE